VDIDELHHRPFSAPSADMIDMRPCLIRTPTTSLLLPPRRSSAFIHAFLIIRIRKVHTDSLRADHVGTR
jgi:hypothetical protein